MKGHHMQEQAEFWIAHRLVYSFLGQVYYETPTAELIQTLAENDLFADWLLESENSEIRVGLNTLRTFTQQWEDGQLAALRQDYARLFEGPGHLLAVPWESVYRSPDRLIFDRQTLEVRACYQRFGFVGTPKNEPDDHFGLEMHFIAHLSALALEALEHDHTEQVVLLSQALQNFLTEHILRWSAEFLAAVQDNAQTPYYRGLAQLTAGCLAHTAQALPSAQPMA